MLTKTKNGYGVGSYEAIPGIKIHGRKITLKESTVALYRLQGLSQVEAAEQMHCSKSNVNQMWQSIFFKTHTNDALTAVIKLIDLGVVKHLILCFIIFSTTLAGFQPLSTDPIRPPQPSVRLRIKRQSNIAGLLA